MSFIEDIEALVAANANGLLSCPPSWTRQPLGAVAEVVNGFAFQSKYFGTGARGEGIPLVRIRDVIKGRSETLYGGPVPEGYWVDDGDLLVGMDGDFNLASWRGGRALLNQRVCKIVCDERKIRGRYLTYVLPGYLKLINDYTSSVTVKHLSSRTLQKIPIPVPSVSVQDRLIARIDELFSEIKEGESALADARAGLDTHRTSFLNAAVTGALTAKWRDENPNVETGGHLLLQVEEIRDRTRPTGRKLRARAIENEGNSSPPLSLPNTWTWASLPQLGEFGRGKSKHRPRNDLRLYGGPYPFIQTGIVAASYGTVESFDQTYSEFGVAQSKLWPAGTVCITIAANIAASGILEFAACFPDSIVGLICCDGIVPEFVELFVRTARDNLERFAPATAQKNINLEILYELRVPLPPTAEQREIVRLVNQAEQVAADFSGDELFATQIRDLEQAVLRAAFRGKLIE